MHVRFIFFASSEIIMDDMSIKSRRTRSISDTLKILYIPVQIRKIRFKCSLVSK